MGKSYLDDKLDCLYLNVGAVHGGASTNNLLRSAAMIVSRKMMASLTKNV